MENSIISEQERRIADSVAQTLMDNLPKGMTVKEQIATLFRMIFIRDNEIIELRKRLKKYED